MRRNGIPTAILNERQVPQGNLGYAMQICGGVGYTAQAWVGDVMAGGYRAQKTGPWKPLITRDNCPASLYFSSLGQPDHVGGYAVGLSRTNSQKLYLGYKDRILKSLDGTNTWTIINCPAFPMLTNAGLTTKQSGQKCEVDPLNDDVAYFGAAAGVYFTINGNDCDIIAGIPAATSSQAVLVCIDMSSPSVARPGGGTRKSRVLIYSAGNGFYLATFAADGTYAVSTITTSLTGPASQLNYQPDGKVYLTIANVSVNTWTFAGGMATFSVIGSPKYVTVNPSNTAQKFAITTEIPKLWDGTTWYTYNPSQQGLCRSSATPAVKAVIDGDKALFLGISLASCEWDSDGTIWAAGGLGPVKIAPGDITATPTLLYWTPDTEGTEMLVTRDVKIATDGKILITAVDRPCMVIDDPKIYPTIIGPKPAPISDGGSSDYAPEDPSWKVTCDWKSAASVAWRQGDGPWTQCVNIPPLSNNTRIICLGVGKYIVFSAAMYPRYTLDNGATPWVKLPFPVEMGTGESFVGQLFSSMVGSYWDLLVADKDVPGTAYHFNRGSNTPGDAQDNIAKGLWKITLDSGGATVERINSTYILVGSGAGSDFGRKGGYHGSMKMMGGHMFLATGTEGGYYDAAPSLIMRRNVTPGDYTTFEAVPNLYEVHTFALGTPAPGTTVPTLWAVGWTAANGYGLYRSHDRGDTVDFLGKPKPVDRVTAMAADRRAGKYGRTVMGTINNGSFLAETEKRFACS